MKEFSGVFSDPLVVSRNKSIKECSRSIDLCLVPEAFRRLQEYPGASKRFQEYKVGIQEVPDTSRRFQEYSEYQEVPRSFQEFKGVVATLKNDSLVLGLT